MVDFKDITGMESEKRALEVAAVQNSSVLITGPAGVGKTLLMRGYLDVVTTMSDIHVVKVDKADTPKKIQERVLLSGARTVFLRVDDFPELSRRVRFYLKDLIEKGGLGIVAVSLTCPCGNYTSRKKGCTCRAGEIMEYNSRVFIDIFDVYTYTLGIPYSVTDEPAGEPSSAIIDRVIKAREVLNRHVGSWIFNDEAKGLFKSAEKRLGLNPKEVARAITLAKSVAALEGQNRIQAHHIAEALQYRYHAVI